MIIEIMAALVLFAALHFFGSIIFALLGGIFGGAFSLDTKTGFTKGAYIGVGLFWVGLFVAALVVVL